MISFYLPAKYTQIEANKRVSLGQFEWSLKARLLLILHAFRRQMKPFNVCQQLFVCSYCFCFTCCRFSRLQTKTKKISVWKNSQRKRLLWEFILKTKERMLGNCWSKITTRNGSYFDTSFVSLPQPLSPFWTVLSHKQTSNICQLFG